MEKENMELYQDVQENVAAQNRADAKTAEIFAFFDEVCAAVVAVLPTVGSDQYGINGRCFYRFTQSGRNFLWRICKRGRC
jgi:hypothetical protein